MNELNIGLDINLTSNDISIGARSLSSPVFSIY